VGWQYQTVEQLRITQKAENVQRKYKEMQEIGVFAPPDWGN
jgi:hypothetical protein